ncbi:MAG TPA: hypothetical protein VKX45_18555 [Bryobacteraceae bacterium]|nr:hypothetical protein [Bryobacteraceae bacterium]
MPPKLNNPSPGRPRGLPCRSLTAVLLAGLILSPAASAQSASVPSAQVGGGPAAPARFAPTPAVSAQGGVAAAGAAQNALNSAAPAPFGPAPAASAQAGAPPAAPQSGPELREILQRLDRLEAQNKELLAKVNALQEELAAARGGATVASDESTPAAAGPTLAERLAAQEARTAEQQQTKVESSERFPIRLTGMALFNVYRNSEYSGAAAFPTAAVAGGASGGATFRQSILGLDYFGPHTFGGGKISGSVRMDFYGGSGQALDQVVRLRTASIGIDWADRGFRVALDKPLVAMREPESLAQVGVPTLTGAGNLWLWIPQARFEQVYHFGESSGIRADVAAVTTNVAGPVYGANPYKSASAAAAGGDPTRPGIEGRLEFFRGGEDRRIEVAPAFHHSVAHVVGLSAPTDVYSLDWLARIVPALSLTGTVFTGTDTAALGGLQQGVLVYGTRYAAAVSSAGGWGQLTWRVAPRLWFNFFSGEEAPRRAGLPAGSIARSLAYGANVFYQFAPSVIGSFEVHQYRTAYVNSLTLLSNHYDLALAYRF